MKREIEGQRCQIALHASCCTLKRTRRTLLQRVELLVSMPLTAEPKGLRVHGYDPPSVVVVACTNWRSHTTMASTSRFATLFSGLPPLNHLGSTKLDHVN